MLSSVLLSTATLLLGFTVAQSTDNPVTGKLGNATCHQNNPPGVVYMATLPEKASTPQENSLKGTVSAVGNDNGIGVKFDINFSNFPKAGGPFIYHIHTEPVPENGDCAGTGSHLDPFQRGDKPPCNPKLPQTCEVGDLSGKHGKITDDPFTKSYVDEWASTLDTTSSFFGNRSVVVHDANGTRLGCANFVLKDKAPEGSGAGDPASDGTPATPPTTDVAGAGGAVGAPGAPAPDVPGGAASNPQDTQGGAASGSTDNAAGTAPGSTDNAAGAAPGSTDNAAGTAPGSSDTPTGAASNDGTANGNTEGSTTPSPFNDDAAANAPMALGALMGVGTLMAWLL